MLIISYLLIHILKQIQQAVENYNSVQNIFIGGGGYSKWTSTFHIISKVDESGFRGGKGKKLAKKSGRPL